MKTNSRHSSCLSRAAFAAALTLFGVTCLPLTAQAAGRPLLPPGLNLGHRAHGEEAIALLGAKLPDVAVAYGLRPAELGDLLRKNSSLWVDPQGALLYLCEGLEVAGAGGLAAGATVVTTVGAAPVAATPATFTLHSTPGAARVIYLDFTGHVTSGTPWNSTFTGGADIVSQPFDLDGDASTFSEAECTFIYRVWQRAAQDFAPFEVDVTTEDPGIEALRSSGGGDGAYGQRVVITPTNWYSTNAGGVSYVGSFGWASDTPNFVFTQQLANGEKYIAEAISHETGHALGLNHEGQGGSAPTEYYAGQGDWAPIMGNSYYRPVTQWAKGEYLNANNLQDQLAVMQNYGAPLVANTFGGSLGSATVVTGPGFSLAGTIMTRTDADVFRFETGAGEIAFIVTNPTPEPNMNLSVQLLDAAGVVRQAGTPAVTSVTLSATVAAGTYYLKISGTGNGDPVTTGYSNYASLGDYVLTGALVPVTTSTNQTPVAVVTAAPTAGIVPLPVVFSSAGSYDADGSITGRSWNFGDGSASTEANPSHTYTSAGSYVATLTVTDDRGAVSEASVLIEAGAAPVVNNPDTDVDLAQFGLTATKAQSGTTAKASLLVLDRLGRAAAGVTVSLRWSGLVAGTATGTTDASGRVAFTSGRSKKTGTATATITTLTPPAGVAYDAAIYGEPMIRSISLN